jgi:electron transfer flavoprotein beta subunit
VKVVPKPEEVKVDTDTMTIIRTGVENELNPACKHALEMGLQLKDEYGGEVILLSMGPPFFESFLKTGITMGADDAILLSDRDFAGADTYATSYALAEAVRKIGGVDLILCGEETSDSSTGQVPPGIAEWLDIPQMTYVSELRLDDDRRLVGKRSITGGHEVVAVEMPAVVSTEIGVNSPRFPDFRRKRWAEREFQLKIWDSEELGAKKDLLGLQGSHTSVDYLIEAKPPERRREFLEGTPEELAKRIYEVIEHYL